MTTEPGIRPGTVLARSARNPASHWPQISHVFYTVSRVTTTQAIAIGDFNREIRVRLKDLGVVGETYARVVIATEDMLTRNAAQVAELARFRAAHELVAKDLIGKDLHQLKLTTKQLEALAKAWTDIKQIKD